jgi:hypothetical protein
MLLRRQTPNCLAKSEGVLLQSVSCLYQGWWSSAVDWPSRAASMDPRCQGQQVRARRGPRRTGWKCDDGSETAAQRGMRCGMLVDGGLSDGVCMGMCANGTQAHDQHCVYCCGGTRKSVPGCNNAWSKFGTVAGGQAIRAGMVRRRAYSTALERQYHRYHRNSAGWGRLARVVSTLPQCFVAGIAALSVQRAPLTLAACVHLETCSRQCIGPRWYSGA